VNVGMGKQRAIVMIGELSGHLQVAARGAWLWRQTGDLRDRTNGRQPMGRS
jgi:hypothetical protein